MNGTINGDSKHVSLSNTAVNFRRIQNLQSRRKLKNLWNIRDLIVN